MKYTKNKYQIRICSWSYHLGLHINTFCLFCDSGLQSAMWSSQDRWTQVIRYESRDLSKGKIFSLTRMFFWYVLLSHINFDLISLSDILPHSSKKLPTAKHGGAFHLCSFLPDCTGSYRCYLSAIRRFPTNAERKSRVWLAFTCMWANSLPPFWGCLEITALETARKG